MPTTSKYDFILSSINDIQSTIRAIDNKLIAFLVILILPITKLDVLIAIFIELINWNCIYGYVIISIFSFIWLVGLIMSLIGIISLENPSKHIKGAENYKGLFYNANEFNIKNIQILFPKKVTTTNELSKIIENLNISDAKLLEELIFEQSKLIFIRDLKIKRQKVAIISIAISALLFLINWSLILTQILTK